MPFRSPLPGALFLLMVAVPPQVAADPIPIVRYDVSNAAVSGTGAWAHVYTGTITPAGSFADVALANYDGGSGTLNDGIIGATHLTTQLFIVEPRPVITLFFDRPFSLTSLTLFGGDDRGNFIPGAIVGTVTVSAAGVSAAIPTVPFGFPTQPNNEFLQLLGTPLDSLLVDRVSLSGFQSTFSGPNYSFFSIAEIRVEGTAAPVPEPNTLMLLGTGTALALRARRRFC